MCSLFLYLRTKHHQVIHFSSRTTGYSAPCTTGPKLLVMMKTNNKKHENKTTVNNKNNNDDDMVVPYLGEDIMYNIFIMADAHQLHDQLMYGCKQWYKLITRSSFIDDHLHQTNPIWIAIPYFDTRDHLSLKPDESKMFVIGVCNGLLLLEDNVEHRLSVSNPVINQLQPLPLTARYSYDFARAVLHGITFVDSTREYKVASFVIDPKGSIGCELLTLGSSTLKWVSSSLEPKWVSSFLEPIGEVFIMHHDSIISINGVFHFIIRTSTYCPLTFSSSTFSSPSKIISFDAKEEIFYISQVPLSHQYMIRWEVLHEIHGYPSVVVPNQDANEHSEFWQWDVWVLKDLYSGEWDKKYTVNLTAYGDYLSRFGWGFLAERYNSYVLLTLENGKFFILRRRGQYGYEHYVYDVQLQELRCLELNPHVQYVFKPQVETLVLCPKP